MVQEESSRLSWLRIFPVYSTGFFSLSIQPMMSLLIPLWALHMGASPLMIGLSLSAGAIFPTLFSITCGAIIDRFGSKTILRFTSLSIAVMAVIYPVFPFIAVLMLMQLFFGQIQSMSWISAQTYVGKLSQQSGKPTYASNFSFAVNLGSFVGPLIVGFAWDYIAPWTSFVAVSVWSIFLWLSVLMLPAERVENGIKESVSINNLLPRWRHYQRAFSLFVLPAMIVVIYGTFMRLSAFNIKNSFYPVYLEKIHFSVSTIATLVSVWSLAGTISSLAVSFLSRFFRSETILFVALVISILPLCLTPLLSDYWFQVAINIISGFGVGMTLPLLISVLGNAVSPQEQGIAVGIRSTASYTASVVIPFLFGVMVQGVGLTPSFYIIGATLLIPMCFIVPLVLRNQVKIGTTTHP